MGTIALPIPWVDYHRAGHPFAFAFGQPDPCPFCGKTRAEQEVDDAKRREAFYASLDPGPASA